MSADSLEVRSQVNGALLQSLNLPKLRYLSAKEGLSLITFYSKFNCKTPQLLRCSNSNIPRLMYFAIPGIPSRGRIRVWVHFSEWHFLHHDQAWSQAGPGGGHGAHVQVHRPDQAEPRVQDSLEQTGGRTMIREILHIYIFGSIEIKISNCALCDLGSQWQFSPWLVTTELRWEQNIESALSRVTANRSPDNAELTNEKHGSM